MTTPQVVHVNTPEARRGVDRHAQDQFSDLVVARRAAGCLANTPMKQLKKLGHLALSDGDGLLGQPAYENLGKSWSLSL